MKSSSFVSKILNRLFSLKNFSDEQKEIISQKLSKLANEEINILVVGGTGVGKSSTINALFQVDSEQCKADVAKVGTGPNPETQVLTKYRLAQNLIIWDSPGLGESTVADIAHTRAINAKLREFSDNEKFLIDLVLVVLDGGSRDYDSTFRLLKLILPSIKDKKRILVAINRIDMVAQGEGWDRINNKPTPKLQDIIRKKVESVKSRIFNDSRLAVEPIPYCAGRTDEGWGGSEPYQITELFCQIVSAIPDEKRIAVIERVKPEIITQSTHEQKRIIERRTSDSLVKAIPRVAIGILTGGIGLLTGGCFITTAVCQHLNKSDNCHMLYAFRQFRDGWLLKQKDGPDLIERYYLIAPILVNKINQCENSNDVYKDINEKYLSKCYMLIKKKNFVQCKNLYIRMVNDLQLQFL